ncbi:MAG: peptidoglycan DD-metalloendopeptidase family protein [Deltaproteobacteria bacterium]|nr:peptidoglycan DD-metalloendopeptidase family protein [Deltaproteobacteria bacterium]
MVKPGETMFDIFKRYGLSIQELLSIREASAGIHRLKKISAGQPYRIRLDSDNNVLSLTYRIDDEALLRITRGDPDFRAEKIDIPFERKVGNFGGVIETSLYDSLGNSGESALLAYAVADIFSWDIDFTADLRAGDSYRVIVEELWLDGRFRRYGKVLAAEFINDGTTFRAYRYEANGNAGYFDDDGNSLRKAFLKAPLNFRRISSGFSRSRLHPVLKIRCPHLGVDYVAPIGTPVSALGEGSVRFAGWKGANGRLVVLSHPMGYKTYYGHLSRIARGIRPGSQVRQGDVIGYVGATGRATGPHLHFQIKRNGGVLNPLSVKIPRGNGVPKAEMADFRKLRAGMAETLASIVISPGKPVPGDTERAVASSR